MKKGIFTSEFWLAILGGLIGPGGLLLMLQDKLDGMGLMGVVIAQVIASAAVIYKYINSREKVKTK